MRKLGISIYPEHATFEKNKTYLNLAKKYGFTRIFTCLLSSDGDLDTFKKTISYAKNLNFKIIADVSPAVLNKLGVDYDNLEFFNTLNVDGLRLDESYSGNEESIMTFNPYELIIELNASTGTKYLENILSYHPNLHKLTGCHNFYPKRLSGLSKENFIKSSLDFKKAGIRLAAFVNSQNATFGPWNISEGLCTLEEHRDLPIDTQAKDLFYSDLIDDVIIANCFASEEELKKLSEINKELITLDIETEIELSDTEYNIVFKELHYYRGDASNYTIRSTMPRIKYTNSIPPKNTRDIQKGDVFIENDNYLRYKGELHIALQNIKNNGKSNVIGRISNNDLRFLDIITPWKKFKLKKL
ncbi:hypothetical protein EV215_0283 [Hypnocyclicus thermotrophus]|uniref:Outer surface protein n=1 Tax=Hypnocyclicus thermotrophus TaxID=1627895 RepID=A0AA46I6L6_9FUSO|nr:MupG family TIM beta-alpha barrel fold protein [Hypnocyclicus thermotrophus]TDT72477.1 hypothetical protein EV215_0283 [Hypnocyclicus thermotrophus]